MKQAIIPESENQPSQMIPEHATRDGCPPWPSRFQTRARRERIGPSGAKRAPVAHKVHTYPARSQDAVIHLIISADGTRGFADVGAGGRKPEIHNDLSFLRFAFLEGLSTQWEVTRRILPERDMRPEVSRMLSD